MPLFAWEVKKILHGSAAVLAWSEHSHGEKEWLVAELVSRDVKVCRHYGK